MVPGAEVPAEGDAGFRIGGGVEGGVPKGGERHAKSVLDFVEFGGTRRLVGLGCPGREEGPGGARGWRDDQGPVSVLLREQVRVQPEEEFHLSLALRGIGRAGAHGIEGGAKFPFVLAERGGLRRFPGCGKRRRENGTDERPRPGGYLSGEGVAAGEDLAVEATEGLALAESLARGWGAGAEGSNRLLDLEVDFLQLDFFGRLRCGSQVGGFRSSRYRVPGCRLIGGRGGKAPAENRG